MHADLPDNVLETLRFGTWIGGVAQVDEVDALITWARLRHEMLPSHRRRRHVDKMLDAMGVRTQTLDWDNACGAIYKAAYREGLLVGREGVRIKPGSIVYGVMDDLAAGLLHPNIVTHSSSGFLSLVPAHSSFRLICMAGERRTVVKQPVRATARYAVPVTRRRSA